MKEAFTYFAVGVATAAIATAQPALGQQVANMGGNGPKRVLMECDTSGKQCQVVRRLRSPAACQASRVNASLHHRGSNFVCARE
jgi:hypothetical protein